MKELALLAALAAAPQLASYTIVVEPSEHLDLGAECAPFLADEQSDMFLGNNLCVLQAKLPFDDFACMLNHIRVVTREEADNIDLS